MNLRIANVKTLRLQPGETAVYVGRGRAPAGMEHARLGNPFRVGQEYAQGEAAAAYLPWLREQCRRPNSAVLAQILRLARRAAAGEALVFCCWCDPQPCHAAHVQAAVAGYAARLKEE